MAQNQPHRLAQGGVIDRTKPLRFTFNGRALTGYEGDTLASALLANGVAVVGRSFKYHRPRGIYGAGAEEPNAILDVTAQGRHDPNAKATLLPLTDGMVAKSIELLARSALRSARRARLLQRFLPGGFYYKTFMRPSWHLHEPYIRRHRRYRQCRRRRRRAHCSNSATIIATCW